jgi:multidrug efflux pump subunit AcrA (membrane-fusion protein)
MSRRLLVIVAIGVIAVAGVGLLIAVRPRVSAMADDAPVVPTTRIQRGSLTLVVHFKGDLRASRQQVLMAPAVGAQLRMLTLAEGGTRVKAGDVVLSFDPADQLYALEQARSELAEVEQEIVKRRADVLAQQAQDQVTLLTAQFNVRRAELDAAVDRDLIPANDHQIRQASLQEAKRTLAQTEQDVQSRGTTSKASLTVLEEKRLKAKAAADRAQQNIESLTLTAPMDAVVAIRENQDASGGVYFSGMTLPPYRVGDTVNPGRPVVDLFDVSGMEIRASVNEQDRTNLEVGQIVEVASSVAPDTTVKARITAISGLGRPVRQAGPLRQFEVTLALEAPDTGLRPGASVTIVARGATVDNVLIAPRQAVFEADGKPIVYVRTGTGFEPTPVTVKHRTESRVAFEGLEEGTEVALVDPKAAIIGKPGQATPPAAPAVPAGGAR